MGGEEVASIDTPADDENGELDRPVVSLAGDGGGRSSRGGISCGDAGRQRGAGGGETPSPPVQQSGTEREMPEAPSQRPLVSGDDACRRFWSDVALHARRRPREVACSRSWAAVWQRWAV